MFWPLLPNKKLITVGLSQPAVYQLFHYTLLVPLRGSGVLIDTASKSRTRSGDWKPGADQVRIGQGGGDVRSAKNNSP